MSIALSCSHISKDFTLDGETFRILNDISLDLASSTLTMLVGPSGCGKTTLISILSGILSATSGSVTLYGQKIDHLSMEEKVIFRRDFIGFIFQQYHLLPALTSLENVALPLIAKGLSLEEACEKAKAFLIKVDMQDHENKYPKHLSGGQQQRIAIARALVNQPKIIICDEPTSALDAKSGHHIMELLKAISQEKDKMVLVVTHDPRIYPFADRIIEMEDGRLRLKERS